MAEHKVSLRASVAWWWHFYIAGVIIVSFTTFTRPCPHKLKRVAFRAVRCEVVTHKGS